MFKAAEIMTEAVVSVPPEMPIYDAIRILANRNITGLPVVDADLRLVGMLTERDVLQLMYDHADREDKTVADYMSKAVVTRDVHDNMVDLCDCLMEHPARRVPVVEEGRLAGVTSYSDLIRAILRIKHQCS